MSRPILTEYADYACPYCYLAHGRLDEYRDERGDLAVDWRPYDIRNETRDSDGGFAPDADLDYPERVEREIADLRAEYGADEMLTPETVPKVDSLPAQTASGYVADADPDRWRAFDTDVFEALWVEGRDISDPDELATIAESTGLDDGAVRDAATNDDRRTAVLERFADARSDGITDAPTFVHDDHTATGVLSPDEIDALLADE